MVSSISRAKGQLSIEFMIMAGILMIIFVLVTGIYSTQSVETMKKALELQVSNQAEAIAYTLNTALIEGDGYSTTLSLPQTIGAFNYSVSINSGAVFLKLTDYPLSTSRKLLTNQTLALQLGTNSIRNQGGVLSVT